MSTVRKLEVIETTLTVRGNGKDDPLRPITQYWDLDGKLLAEYDPAKDHDVSIAKANQRARF